MPTIANYIDRSAVFEPEAILVMGEAYERALSTFATRLPESVRQVLAARIIELAAKGERDPHKLCEECLTALNGQNAYTSNRNTRFEHSVK